MKNLFFSLVFVLIGSFAFAENSVESLQKGALVENLTKTLKQEDAKKANTIHVTLSCGVEYDITNFTGTTTQLLNSVIGMNNAVCGTNISSLP